MGVLTLAAKRAKAGRRGLHRVTATGVDLTQDWRIIHQRLLDIVTDA
jgi:hypothetical protein